MTRFLLVPLGLVIACARGQEGQIDRSSPPHTYVTEFAQTESPLSEAGRWRSGGTDGRDWTNVSTTPGLAIGHQVAARNTDATAILTGNWHPDQGAIATVYSVGRLDDKCRSGIALRLRSSIDVHRNRGYAVAFSASQTDGAYLAIVRWNGALGDMTTLLTKYGAQYGVKNADVVKATVIGRRITAYKNGAEVAHVDDAGIMAGSPGFGLRLANSRAGCPGTNDRYGLSRFSATDSAGK